MTPSMPGPPGKRACCEGGAYLLLLLLMSQNQNQFTHTFFFFRRCALCSMSEYT